MSKRQFQPEDMKNLRYLSETAITEDGKCAACVCSVGEEDSGLFESQIFLADLISEKIQPLEKPKGINHTQPQFAGGSLFYLSDESGEKQLYKRKLQDGSVTCLTSARHGIQRYSVSSDGTTAVLEMELWQEEITQNQCFQTMTPEEKKQWEEELAYRPYEITDLTYKMDEWHGMRQGQLPRVAVVDLISGTQSLIVKDELESVYPVVSEDGKWVAFYGYPYQGAFGRQPEIFVCQKDGTKRRQLTEHIEVCIDGHMAFSRKGDELFFITSPAFEDGSGLLLPCSVNIQTGVVRNMIKDDEDQICHGIHAFPTNRTEYGEPYRYFCEDGEGQFLYFLSSFHGRENLYRKSLNQIEKPMELVEKGRTAIHEFALSREGTMVYLMADLEKPVELYKKREGEEAKCLTNVNDWLKDYEKPQTEEFWIRSEDDEEDLQIWLMHPSRQEEGRLYPAVLYVRGGPTATYNGEYWHEFHALACAGMAVIYLNPRGSFGYGRKFCSGGIAWTTKAMDDLLTAVKACVKKGFIDPERIGVTGGSYGGYMTNKLIGRTDCFSAAVTQRCLVNPVTSYGTGDMGFISYDPSAVGNVKMLDYLEDRARGNPLTYIDHMKVPLLILHGYQDYRCSFEQAEQLFIAMKERNPKVPVRMVMFPKENHGVDRTGKLYNQIQHLQEMTDWFVKYLGEGGADHE